MNFIQTLFPTEVLQAIGWTLLHSLWQAVVLALLLAAVLTIWKKKAATLRYAATVSTLALLILCVIGTFIFYYEPAPGTAALGLLGAEELLLQEQGWLAWLADYFQHNMPLLVLLWFFGVAVLSLRFFGEIAYTWHLKNYQVKAVSNDWQNRTLAIAQKMGLKRQVILKETFRVNTPMVVGIFKPIILMPIGLLSGLTNAQVESILAHELAHIRRHDFAINLFQSFIEVLLFFNPAVWWISACVRSERENCCDDLAIQITGDATIYVKTLAQLETMRMPNGQTALAFSGQGGVLQRIKRILYQKSSTPVLSKGFWSACVMMICLFLAVFNLESQSITFTAPADEAIAAFLDETFETYKKEYHQTEKISSEEKKSPDYLKNEGLTAIPPKLTNIPLSPILAKASTLILRDTVPDKKEKLDRKPQTEEELAQYKAAKEAYEKAMKEIEAVQVQELKERMKVLESELRKSTELAREKQAAIKKERVQQFEMELQARDEELKMHKEKLELEQMQQEAEMQQRKAQKELEIEHFRMENQEYLAAKRKKLDKLKAEYSESEWQEQLELFEQEEARLSREAARAQKELEMEMQQVLANQERQAAVAQIELARAKKEMELQQRQFTQELKLEEMRRQAAEIEELKHRQADELLHIKQQLENSLQQIKDKLQSVEQELKSREGSKKKGTLH